jgi:DNA helicase-4
VAARSASKEQYGISSITLDGKKVQSIKEKTIGDFLFLHGVKYEYEKVLLDPSTGKPVAKPDFYLPELGVYIEYWGRTDNEKYSYNMRRKKRIYESLNCKVVSIYPRNMTCLEWTVRKEVKALTGKDFPPLLKDRQEAV